MKGTGPATAEGTWSIIGRNRRSMTSEGHPGARLQRALAAGNLPAAEQAAFEVAFRQVPPGDASDQL